MLWNVWIYPLTHLKNAPASGRKSSLKNRHWMYWKWKAHPRIINLVLDSRKWKMTNNMNKLNFKTTIYHRFVWHTSPSLQQRAKKLSPDIKQKVVTVLYGDFRHHRRPLYFHALSSSLSQSPPPPEICVASINFDLKRWKRIMSEIRPQDYLKFDNSPHIV